MICRVVPNGTPSDPPHHGIRERKTVKNLPLDPALHDLQFISRIVDVTPLADSSLAPAIEGLVIPSCVIGKSPERFTIPPEEQLELFHRKKRLDMLSASPSWHDQAVLLSP
jgi:hypothetical protein